MSAITTSRIGSVAVPLGAVALMTVVLRLADADLTVAALCFVGVVVLSSLLGLTSGVVSVAAAFLVTNYFFTAPVDSFRIDKTEDLVALVVFALTAGVLSAAVARVNLLRLRAQTEEREAKTRLELTERLTEGQDPVRVATSAAESVRELFGFEDCRITLDAEGGVTLHTVPSTAMLSPGDRTRLDAFMSGVAASLDRERLDRDARNARAEAEIEQGRSGFLASMTHNLRTPLASIGAAASVMLDPRATLDRTQEVELLETIRGEADRLDRLVTKVLLLARIQSGVLTLATEPVEVDEIVEASARRVRLIGLGRVQVVGAEDQPPVCVDRVLVEVALVNVLENALRYSGADTMVEVNVSRSGAASDEVSVSVVDHGPGIPPEDRERVFERFVRGPSADDGVGGGIGLAITREFVQAHGGRCWLEETPGGGATVIMTLPAVAGSA